MGRFGKLNLLGVGLASVSLGLQAEIQALDEATMSNVTGQAGISIEINNAAIGVGEIRYEDEGSIAIRGIEIGGANRNTFFGNQWIPNGLQSDKLDNMKLDLDVLADGSLVANMKPAGGFNVVDFRLATDDWYLMDSSLTDGTKLIDSLSIEGIALGARLRIDNQTSHATLQATFGVDDLDVDIEFLNVRVENMQIAGSSYLEAIGSFGPSGAGVGDIGAEIEIEIYSSGPGLAIDLNRFEMDVVMPEIYLGANPSIGGVYLDDVNVVAQTVIYGH
ncbi:hypothetical protein OLMES_2603 [Oleiphilus messinensis]|uniref:DUF6160 domain-containing protein n=1 Tax=Oleiphilus messinensis TaxID=141451 RepID=A0A1Y0IB86_9GAMM|nr:DUF6160 family protein [Oleiphilus messinensis]ARU56653.1 hypothetical protein OLMES_2603 [Oleiphilus messinensis]